MSGFISFTAWQAVGIYGWWKPLRVLNWKMVVDRKDLTVEKLCSLGLNEQQLFTIQSDKTAWISISRIGIEHIAMVPMFQIHATKDLGANIIAIARQNLTAGFLQHTGVTFTDLVDAGLTLNLMLLFKYDLTSWVHLGLYRDFLRDLTDVQSISLFEMTTFYVMQCVKETASNRTTPTENTPM